MSTISSMQSGLSGIQSGLQSLNNNATKIVNAGTLQTNTDITEPLVDMISDKQQVQASAKVIEANNTMLGSILDITA